jgi:methyl-accepting chemotaxis protein-2 (aspartate sensor receptor)
MRMLEIFENYRSSLAWKLSALSTLAVILVLSITIASIGSRAWVRAQEDGDRALLVAAQASSELLTAYYDGLSKKVVRDFAGFRVNVERRLQPVEETGAGAQAQPRLVLKREPLEGPFELVDEFARLNGGGASVFARVGADFERVITSAKKPDGSRAIGTRLGADNPVTALLLQGKPYLGPTMVMGKIILARYEPILRDGRVIGAMSCAAEDDLILGAMRASLGFVHPVGSGRVYALELVSASPTVYAWGLEDSAITSATSAASPRDMAGFRKMLQDGADGQFTVVPWTPTSAASDAQPHRLAVIKNAAWHVAVVADAPLAVIELPAVRTIEELAVTGAAIVAVMMLINILFARRFVAMPIGRLIHDLTRFSDNDLALPLASGGNDEIGRLSRSMERFRTQLVQSLGIVRCNAHSVAAASVQIADGSKNLSLRTAEQIDLLKYTFSTMDELLQKVGSNAKSADQATELAMRASLMAAKGGEDVDRIVQTMESINESSKTIAGIISVIDGIAFQTNILALNAAVEAARAGAQGRGFAVVASEVRLLAQRSADAARDIKALISASVAKVAQGVLIVDHAGKTIEAVVAETQRVSQIIDAVRQSSTEQQSGLSQVAEAVTCLDRSTQQNVSLVADSASSSDGLKEQANRLVAAVAAFHLVEGQDDAEADRLASPVSS